MTDFTREDMRERIARALWAQEHRHTNRAVFEDNSQPYFEDAEALMHELGLWEAYEALIALDRLREGCAPDELGAIAGKAVATFVEQYRASLARLRGETK